MGMRQNIADNFITFSCLRRLHSEHAATGQCRRMADGRLE